MFEFIADIERYPDFLPGWSFVAIRRRTEATMDVHQVIRMAGIRLAFESSATLERPTHITIVTESGIFKSSEIEWRFEPREQRLLRALLERQQGDRARSDHRT